MILPISVGILSWKSGQTLRNTLETYKKNNLFDIINDVVILFQEVTDQDKQLAKEYSLPFIGLDKNIGIGKAFVMLAEQSDCENILLLEHDWQLTEDYSTTKERLKKGIDFLNKGVSSVRLRSRKKPGYPLFSRPAYEGRELEHFDPIIGLTSPHLMDCIHWIEEPELKFPLYIKKHEDHFITKSRWSNWNNNPALYKKDFYINTVTPFLKDDDLLLEPVISRWWAEQNYDVAWGEGLFTHCDIEKYGE